MWDHHLNLFHRFVFLFRCHQSKNSDHQQLLALTISRVETSSKEKENSDCLNLLKSQWPLIMPSGVDRFFFGLNNNFMAKYWRLNWKVCLWDILWTFYDKNDIFSVALCCWTSAAGGFYMSALKVLYRSSKSNSVKSAKNR